MGFWGERFFQSDRDFDIVGIVGEHLGIEDLYYPDDPEQLRQELDSGKLEAEFHKIRDGGYESDEDLKWLGFKTTIVVLAAAAMRHGATISDEFRQYVKTALKSRLQMYQRAKDDMAKAIDSYRNGVPLDVAGMGLDETASSDERPKGGFGLNVLSPQMFNVGEVVENECETCGKDSDTLLRCGRCRKVRYCNIECQKKAWKKHKQVCAPAA
ncbi:N-lysine methyltransferase SMYD2 [Lasiodiplodia hormozganensis]|uniref:N-lysine methyltransferase SMYD2 n=1 Tax=Lasiodiplodia hormozganensis TaxID=869390 RepID=A0AA39X081_9PEZI|nr:N-lysine methyltransferase SMYD2 [Lasiodiplodia hormozganensis]